MQKGVPSELLMRRVEKVLPSKEGLAKLLSQKRIRLYQGFDPTGPRLHLGHSIGLRKLMEFANLGHEVIFLFGTGTILVGDPSQREKARGFISSDQVIQKNIKDWKRQASPIVDFSKIVIKRNGDWLGKLTLKDFIIIASNISAVQLFKREMFQRRISQGDTVWYHETMYPLLQGFDSVAMDVDLEIGGTDQEFNMLIGRELQRKMNNREKYILTIPMIMGSDGKPMSKTTGNCVWLDDAPSDMFGKLMSMPDENIIPYLMLVTNVPLAQVAKIEKALQAKLMNPREAKELLAKEVVKDFHSKEAAERTAQEFNRVFRGKKQPAQIPEVRAGKGAALLEVMVKARLASSKSEARRLIAQGGVRVDGAIQKEWHAKVARGAVLQVGPRRFVRIM